MSSDDNNPEFEDYGRVSSYYDKTRVPAGLDIILKMIAQGKGKSTVILDAGCGTGNYLCGVAPHVKQITGLEFNRGMLKQTIAKVGQSNLVDKVKLLQGSLLEKKLPFDDSSFDAIMINQVIHHLDDGSDPTFPNLRHLLLEFARILKPGGFLSINLTTRNQAGSFWWQSLMPRANKDYADKHIPNGLLIDYLTEAGLGFKEMIACKDPLQGDHYFNPAGPLNSDWRNGDSTWSTLTNDELDGIKEFIQTMVDQGIAGRYMDQHDTQRRAIGQSTFVISYKG